MEIDHAAAQPRMMAHDGSLKPVGRSKYRGLTHTDGCRSNKQEMKHHKWRLTRHVLGDNHQPTMIYDPPHGIRSTVQVSIWFGDRTSMFVTTSPHGPHEPFSISPLLYGVHTLHSLHHTALHYNALHDTTVNYIASHQSCITLNYIAHHCTTYSPYHTIT